jgi:hypothetical protein
MLVARKRSPVIEVVEERLAESSVTELAEAM